MSAPGAPFHIAGLGLVTALAGTVEQSCAAIRCNFARPMPLEGVLSFDSESEEEEQVVGHPIAGVTDGFQGFGRWMRLGRLALRDLARFANVASQPKDFWTRLGLVACLPRSATDRFEVAAELAPELPSFLAAEIGWHIPPEHCVTLLGGNEVVFSGLGFIGSQFASGAWQRAVLLTLDTLVDEESIRWLEAEQRLKTSIHPVGLTPGEASASLLLERSSTGAIARVESLAVAPPGPDGSPRSRARSLEAAVSNAFAAGHPSAVGDVIGNLNGETVRSYAWGTAQIRFGGAVAPDARSTWPATSLGDVGVASPAVALCIAARSFQRGYARNNRALVFATADDGSAAACLVVAPASR